MAELSSQTLHLVARELASELNEARAALEAFGEQQDNVALLRRCGAHLHTVHGALRVSEVYGAALLAEEMGQVIRYLIENFAEKRHLAEGLDALMRAMVQLPTYLERVLSGGRDMALVLLPLLNDLRAVRGHALLSEGTLLLLNLSSDKQASPVAAASGEGMLSVAQWARKLRTRFQLGLLGWIKGERIDQNLEVLSRCAEKLEQMATTQPVFQLWWVVGAVLEALRDRGLEGSASIKRLLGQADRDMRRLYEQGEMRYAETPAVELLNNLLYYVARARSSGPRVSAVRASFRLTELLPVDDQVEQARESLSAPSVKLMKTVAAAIKEDLGRVKDALDIFVRQGGTQVDQLTPQLDLLKKIGDTLGVLGLGELRDKVQAESDDLQIMIDSNAEVSEGTLLRMAATLIKVEDSLDEQLVGMIVPSAGDAPVQPKASGPEDIEFRQVTEAVLRECIVNMARIKEAIAHSMEKSREGQVIDQIPQLVRGITAGLLMLGKTRAVEIMEGIDRALKQFVRSDGMTLPPEAVDRLADAIVAVEYYMETLQAGRADPWYMLDNAEACIKYLAETQPIPKFDDYNVTDHARTVVIVEPMSTTVAAPIDDPRVAAAMDRARQQQSTTVQQQPAMAPAAAGAPPAPPPPEREIDPEFLELFIEEAKDEITNLDKLFPRWDENPQDLDALVNIRRSFHTLKGSGRMVGAQLIGDFAWAIESLLNRVINKTLDRTPDMMVLMRQAVAAVPALVEQLETGRELAIDMDELIERAYTLSGTRPPAPPQPANPQANGQGAAAPAAHQSAAVPPAVNLLATAPQTDAAAQKKTPMTAMEPALQEIYAKETAGHLAAIREFIAAGDLSVPPYVVTEDLYRSCHTLSGTAKTAGARQGIKIAEPLNRYIRKLYDNSAGLPAAGMDVLKESVTAIQEVVDNINEDTGFFLSHPRIVARLGELEHALDMEVARLTDTMDVSVSLSAEDFAAQGARGPSASLAAFGSVQRDPTSEQNRSSFGEPAAAADAGDDDVHTVSDVFDKDVFTPDPAAAAALAEAESSPPHPDDGEIEFHDVTDEITGDFPAAKETIADSQPGTVEAADVVELELELPPADADELQILKWSYENFPSDDPAGDAEPAAADTAQGISISQDASTQPAMEAVEELDVAGEEVEEAAEVEDIVLEDTSGAAVDEDVQGEEVVLQSLMEEFDEHLQSEAAAKEPAAPDSHDDETIQHIALTAIAPPEFESSLTSDEAAASAAQAEPPIEIEIAAELDSDLPAEAALEIEAPAEPSPEFEIEIDLNSPDTAMLAFTPELDRPPELDAALTAAPEEIELSEPEVSGAAVPEPEFESELEAESVPELTAADEPDAASAAEPAPPEESGAALEIAAFDAAEEIVVAEEPPAESEPEAEPEILEEPQPEVVAGSEPAPPPAAREVPVLHEVQPTLPAMVAEPADVPEDDDFDPDVAAIFTEEATELLEGAQNALSSWTRDRSNNALVFELKRLLHTLKGGARMAGIRAMGDLSHELETLMERVEGGLVPSSAAVFDGIQTSLDELHRMRDVVSQGNRCKPARELISRIRVLAGHEPAASASEVAPASAPSPVPAPTLNVEAHASDAVPESPEVDAIEPSGVTHEVEEVADATGATGQVPMLTDSVEVAGDAGQEPQQEIAVEHGTGELDTAASYEPEYEPEPEHEAGLIEEPPALQPQPPLSPVMPQMVARIHELPSSPIEEAQPEAMAPAALPPGREQPQAQERQEFARVDADLLDTLLNNAGEVSIFRSRLEQQVGSIEFNLAELGRTVTRLKEQLRKLELETEAQILHRHQEDHPNRTDFDPLELDRYSSIQQLTRAFAEAVSDVGSIEGLLENMTREAQNLLLQQARVVTELQNGLMRTRMVPFQRHVQRLSRLVRQVASDTGKRAELIVTGASGELDRQVLDRMLPPFEHMLRNSVVHGIETPQERAAKGKPENGTISVGLHREGSEMVIVLQDDGRGIDVNAVRERALARGLLHPGRMLSDEEALQLILEPGFSTATSVTQHAGRGVGMDVVVTEIKKLGGALYTESQPGQGVKFTIRLPFTLAITQALIVRAGEELYALPLPSVEGVARVSRSEVQKYLAEESPTFNYGGQVYRLQHLGAFIGGGPSVLPETDVSVPLILIRAGEHSTAVVTDELVGSREMVVKAVGPQISAIRGISGATIMGDGRIVIILDMGALVRSEWRGRAPLTPQGPKQDRRTFALVVDDSITVRRVTQRLLERNGMRVMTAKDGVDALSILQDNLPDVILLDIEMPRMDGYELASHVRADNRLADIPIVMITSRVGEKHRARAIELGVNDYLGKPYQENQLLDAIEPLVQARRQKVS